MRPGAAWNIGLLLAASIVPDVGAATEPETPYCGFAESVDEDPAAGLIVGADVLLTTQVGCDYAVHIRFNGTIGAVGPLDAVREDYPGAAVLDCRGGAVPSPGFVNYPWSVALPG